MYLKINSLRFILFLRPCFLFYDDRMENSAKAERPSRFLTGWKGLAVLSALSALIFIGFFVLSDLIIFKDLQALTESTKFCGALWAAISIAMLVICAMGSWLDRTIRTRFLEGLRISSTSGPLFLSSQLTSEARPPCFDHLFLFAQEA